MASIFCACLSRDSSSTSLVHIAFHGGVIGDCAGGIANRRDGDLGDVLLAVGSFPPQAALPEDSRGHGGSERHEEVVVVQALGELVDALTQQNLAVLPGQAAPNEALAYRTFRSRPTTSTPSAAWSMAEASLFRSSSAFLRAVTSTKMHANCPRAGR